MHLELSTKALKKKDRRNWKSEVISRLFRTQNCGDQLEYSEMSLRPKETFSHFDFSERQPALKKELARSGSIIAKTD